MSTLIFLPGLGCDATIWADQLQAFGELSPAVADQHFQHDSLPDMAAALLARHPGELLLCGASLGGMLALEVCAQAPGRVRGLALLGSSARIDAPERTAMRMQGIRAMQEGGFENVLKANLPFSMHPRSLADKALVARFIAMLRRIGPQELIRQNRVVMRRTDQRALLPRLRCPTLVMCGDADLVTPPEHTRELAQLIAGAQLEWIAGAGHMLSMEQPAAVNAALRAWLARVA
jgi:pimeloyl-ACP methyl ester carboxylesterase